MAPGSFLPLVLFFGLSYAWVEERPVLETQDGNLVIASAKDRNITLLTVGKSSINVNEINLVDVSIRANEAARIVENWENGYLRSLTRDLERLKETIEGPNGLQKQFRQFGLGTGASSNSTAQLFDPRVGIVVRTLARRVRSIDRRLNVLQSEVRVDGCASNPCQNFGTCIKVFNGFQCLCPSTYEGATCSDDVNECVAYAGTDLGCQNGATCTNLPGSYRCACQSGWHGIHCRSKSDACEAQNSGELCGHGVCVKDSRAAIGYTCFCDEGWKSSGTDPACTTDVDECAGKHPACSKNPPVPCSNLPGSYHCGSCPPGFTGNGHYCADINECMVDNGGCSMTPRVNCINTIGSWSCDRCPVGYEGNGITCNYVGICAVNNGGCHPLATCLENPGYTNLYPQCRCPAGYHGDGLGPRGCLPGTESFGPCSNNLCVHGTCKTYGGTYTCVCESGYTGTHCDSAINPCTPNPCKNNGTCKSSDWRNYICECKPKFTGSQCESERQSCGGSFRNPSGTLEYPVAGQTATGGVNCAYLISTNVSSVLSINFTRFQFEDENNKTNPGCAFNFFQIHDGANAVEHAPGRFCGKTMPLNGHFVSTHHVVYFWLKAEKSNQAFGLHWETVKPTCGGVLEADHGTIHSPGSPGKYPNGRDCYWHVHVRPGKRILFTFFTVMLEPHSTCDYDYLEINDTVTEPPTQLGLYCNHTLPAPLMTSGGSALVHFHSDVAGRDFGFQMSYTVVEGVPGCGGVHTTAQGTISSPNFPSNYPRRSNCEWKIQLPKGERIRLTFLSFQLESQASCRHDSVRVLAGPNIDSPLVGEYCGSKLPSPLIIDSNEVLIFFMSDWSRQFQGFQLKYETICGGVFREPSGHFQSPYYPSQYPGYRTCIYEIIAPLGKGIVLNIVDLEIEEDLRSKCLFDRLSIYDGDNENTTLLQHLCGNEIPSQPFYSTQNVMFVKFTTDGQVSNRGFLANYTTVDRRCGDLLTSPTGIIQSQKEGEFYEDNEDCTWIIRAPKGHVVQLTFTSFSLEEGLTCSVDYVLIYDGPSAGGQLMGRFCGAVIPQALTTQSESMTIVFRTDMSVNHGGFIGHYVVLDASKMCGGHYFTSTGVIMSPNYPDPYPPNRECIWIITAPNKQQINLEIEQFELEKVSNCQFDYLEIRNGGYETSPLIGKFCGTTIPHQFKSLTNEMYIKFAADASRHMGGFSLKWDSSSYGCGGTLTGWKGEIISPNYPQPYARLALCVWKIAAAAGSKVRLVMVDFDLEDHSRCRYDYVEITSGLDNHREKTRYCGSNHPPIIDIESNVVSIRFRSDYTTSGRGFHIRYETLCTNRIKGFEGVIESPNFPAPYPPSINCTWIIEAPTGNNVSLTFSHFDLEASSESTNSCIFDYVKIEEGASDEANTDLGTFCGSSIPPRITTSQNQLYLHFISDRYFVNDGFRLEWMTEGCGGHYTRPVGILMSPGYPKAYPENVECEWLIEVDHGQSVEITFHDLNTEKVAGCSYDKVQIYAGGNDKAPQLAEICESKKPVIYTSSSNQMFVKFVGDFSFAGRGFNATYRSVDITCGGKFQAFDGVIHSPNYPLNYPNHQNCEWLLEVDKHYVVKLTFTDFDVEDTTNCTDDYVKVFDGPSRDGDLLGTFCRNELPEPVISSGNSMLVVMRSDNLLSAKGFSANFATGCGARIIADSDGVIEARGIINDADSINCTWIITAKDPADHITVQFSHMEIASTSWDDDCSYGYVRVIEGDGLDGPVFGTWCGSKVPPMITSTGSSITIHKYNLNNDLTDRFGITYSVLNAACGGEYSSASGSLASPLYPASYPNNAECVWLLKTTVGSRISLTFSQFDIQTSANCDQDYLEIREDSGVGKLIGIYCSELPSDITSSSKLWIKFRSDESGTGNGFMAEYTLLHGNELTGVSGEIASPMYPHPWFKEETITWRITVDFGMAVRITFDDVHIENFGSYCGSALTIYDGYNEEAPQLTKVCGVSVPDQPTTSMSNVIFIQLVSEFSRDGQWFHLNWQQVPRVPTTENTEEILSDCVVEHDLTSTKNSSLIFNSPGWPDGYGEQLNCKWIFTTLPGHHLTIRFTDIDLEESPLCLNDYVAIYDGEVNENSLVKQLCHSNETSYKISVHPLMTVTFVTDSYVNKTGFRAVVYRECGGEFSQSTGMIDFNETRNMYEYRYERYRCQWNITVRPGKTINITFPTFDIAASDGSHCKDNYILLKNGISADSPLLAAGKYCGEKPKTELQTSGNKVYLKAVGNKGEINFRMMWEEVGTDCGGSYNLQDTGPVPLQITSPNYPNIPPPYSECFWTFRGVRGDRLSIHFIERFDLTPSANCSKEYVEVRDGGTKHSKLLGRFCSENAPSSLTTSGDMLYVHFYTEVPEPKNGFKAAVTSGEVCGRILRGTTGTITSPNYPQTYPADKACQWLISAPAGHTLALEFRDLHLPSFRRCENSDWVSIEEKLPVSNHLGTWCGSTKPDIPQTSSNEAIVSFGSDNRTAGNYRGFALNFTSSKEPCGGELTGISGEFHSFGYPNPSLHSRYCEWTITVPEGSQVILEFLDFDVPKAEDRNRDSSFYLAIFNDEGTSSRIGNYPAAPIPKKVSSTANVMVVSYWQGVGRRGFKAQFTASSPAPCGGVIDDMAGVLSAPRPPYNETSFYCPWKVKIPQTLLDRYKGGTLTVSISGIIGYYEARTSMCSYRTKYIRIHDGTEEIGTACGNMSQITYTVRTPALVNTIEVMNSSIAGDVKFDLGYEWQACGGILTGPSHTISRPTDPTFPKSCVWHAKFDDTSSVMQLTFNRMNMGSCDKAYLLVRHGGPLSPEVGKFCGNIKPHNITSSSHQLWIEYWAAQEPGDFEFQLSSVGGGCGGAFRGSRNEITSPGYPKQYPDNTECTWEITAEPGYKVGLYFVDRFSLETSDGCKNDFIQMFNWEFDSTGKGGWKEGPKYCGRNTPPIFNATSNRVKLLFRSSEVIHGDGFRILWEQNCGGIFEATGRPQYIVSPHYPSLYTRNQVCNYTIVAPSGKEIWAEFMDFDIEGSTGKCNFDNLTIYTNIYHRFSYLHEEVVCGTNLPAALSSTEVLTMVFKTDEFVVKRGFKVKYFWNECGGEITEPTRISSPTSKENKYFGRLNCTWIIRAPEGQSVVLRFEKFNLESSPLCVFDQVLAVEGDKLSGHAIAKLCGNLTELFAVRSAGNVMAVMFRSDGSNNFGGMSATVIFSDNESSGCGGRLTLIKSENWQASKPVPYHPYQECHWIVRANPGNNVKFTINSMDVKNATNVTNPNDECKGDFLEVRDGGGPLSQLIGRYCGDVIPQPLLSTSNSMWIRFFSDGTNEGRGVTGTLQPMPSACGKTFWEVNDTIILPSPNYPDDYPAGIQCRWVFKTQMYGKLRVHIEDLDMEDTEKCTGDHLEIKDENRRFTDDDVGDTMIMNGKSKWSTPVYRGRYGADATYTYCGKVKAIDYYSNNNEIQITVKTNSNNLPKARKYKFDVSKASCNRNYTSEQGRIVHERVSDCWTSITAPANHTISLYFNQFTFYGPDDCKSSYVQVHDGDFHAPITRTICGYVLPSPIFSIGNKLSLHAKSENMQFSGYDITYTTTDKGRGCGGKIFNHHGVFTSPMYPSIYRNSSTCIWEISVPRGYDVILDFTFFDLGSIDLCSTDYLDVEDLDPVNRRSEIYCGSRTLATFRATSDSVRVTYVSSVNNGGTGWSITFSAVPHGEGGEGQLGGPIITE